MRRTSVNKDLGLGSRNVRLWLFAGCTGYNPRKLSSIAWELQLCCTTVHQTNDPFTTIDFALPNQDLSIGEIEKRF